MLVGIKQSKSKKRITNKIYRKQKSRQKLKSRKDNKGKKDRGKEWRRKTRRKRIID